MAQCKKNTFGDGIYGTPYAPRGDLIAFTKVRKGKFYIADEIDGSGINYHRKFLSRSTILVSTEEYSFFIGRKNLDLRVKITAKLWSIDITGYNEKITTETDASDPSGPHCSK